MRLLASTWIISWRGKYLTVELVQPDLIFSALCERTSQETCKLSFHNCIDYSCQGGEIKFLYQRPPEFIHIILWQCQCRDLPLTEGQCHLKLAVIIQGIGVDGQWFLRILQQLSIIKLGPVQFNVTSYLCGSIETREVTFVFRYKLLDSCITWQKLSCNLF